MEYGRRTLMHSKNSGYLLAIPPVWVRANLNGKRMVMVDVEDGFITIRPVFVEEENDIS